MTSVPPTAVLEEATRAFVAGLEHERRGDRSAAASHYFRAIQTYAAFPDAWRNLAALAQAEGRIPTAIGLLRRALTHVPDSAMLLSRLGDLLRVSFRFDEATASLRRALELDAGAFEAWFNFGLLGADIGDDRGAITCYDRALALAPTDTPLRIAIRWHRAMALLTAGDLAAGFAESEVRYALAPPQRPLAMPLWQGQAIAGRRLLVWTDQGLGDTLQFIRFLAPLAERGARIIFAGQPELVPLLKDFLPIAELMPRGGDTPPADFHVPLMSLPHRLGTTLASLPVASAYLDKPPVAQAPMITRPPGTRLAVGIVWAGDPRHPQDRKRSATLEPFLALCDLPGVVLYSLQKGARAADLDGVGARGLIIDLGARIDDAADAAAAVAELDLVVGVDTFVVHLAGALGRPAFVLLAHSPDWRWMRNREDSPWYPSLRLFRQTAPGDWSGVLARVRTVLAAPAGVPSSRLG